MQEKSIVNHHWGVAQFPCEVDTSFHGAVFSNVPECSSFTADPVAGVVFRNAVPPTEAGLNKKINGAVGQTESHHARSSWNNHTIVVQQRRTGYTPSTDLGSDRPVDGPVSRVQGGEFTVGPPHKEEIGP